MPLPFELMRYTMNVILKDGVPQEWDGSISTLNPLEQYKISDMSTPDDTKYYGFLNSDGGWYIMREVTSEESYRYCKGDSDYTTAWTNKVSLVYTYFDLAF